MLRGVLADRLEHPIARAIFAVATSDEALVEKRLQQIGIGIADELGRLVVAAAGEDREPPEERSFELVEEVVAPLDRCPECLLAWVGVVAAFEQVESLPESFEQLLGGEERCARRCELEREREVVELFAERVEEGECETETPSAAARAVKRATASKREGAAVEMISTTATLVSAEDVGDVVPVTMSRAELEEALSLIHI